MSQHWRSTDSDGDENEEDEEVNLTGRDAILFLVDCSKSMFLSVEPAEEPRSKFRIALQCIEAVMRNRIIMSDTDLIGVIFYNTEHSPDGGLNADMNLVLPKKSAVFFSLDVQKVENIEKIMEFQQTDDFDEFPSKFGHSDDCNMSDIFWFCSKLFTRCGYKTRATSIVLFTDNPLPHPKDSHEWRQLTLKANDLQQNEILVSLMPMSPTFDCDLFYKQFLCVVLDEDFDNFQAPTYEGNISQLTKRVYRRDFRKKANSKIEFEIGDLKFGVALYSMARKVSKPSKLLMDRVTNDLIFKKRVYVQLADDGTKKVMGPGDQRKSIEFGNEKTYFTTEEHSRVHSMIPKGLKLLGFKPIGAVERDRFLNPCLFMFPIDEQFEGSTNIFAALWSRCLARQQVMIAVMVQRYKCTPVYVAMVPQENDDLRKNGFRIIFLPYKDDQRSLDVFTKAAPEVEEADKEVVTKMIKRIKFKFNPGFFENPELKQFYNNIESIVYKTEVVPIKDQSIPVLDDRASDACRAVIEQFGEIGLDDGRSKRAATASLENRKPKIPKLTPMPDVTELELDILSALKQGNESKLKVAELRDYLRAKGVTGISAAKKGDLIDKVKEFHGI